MGNRDERDEQQEKAKQVLKWARENLGEAGLATILRVAAKQGGSRAFVRRPPDQTKF